MGIIIKFEFHLHISRPEKRPSTQRAETPSAESETTQPLLLAAARQKAEQLRNSLGRSTIDNYLTALRSFSRYLGSDIAPSQLDADTIRGYERWMREQGICPNTTSCYMRCLRSLLGKTFGGQLDGCFAGVFRGRAKTEKRAVDTADIARLRATVLPEGSFIALVRDIFLFSFFALGMPFVDIAFLRRSQISGGVINYHRHKTGQRVSVALEPPMQQIIDRYRRTGSDYVFPLLTTSDPAEAYIQYQKKLNRYNRALKRLAKTAGLSCRLTSYTSRHTWASEAYSRNVDLPVISKALGHTNTQTTLTYIREINDRRLHEANRAIVAIVSPTPPAPASLD